MKHLVPVLVLALGCGKKANEACKPAADHILAVKPYVKDVPLEAQAGREAEWKQIAASCAADGWSAEVTTCLQKVASSADMDACIGMLDAEQLASFAKTAQPAPK